MTYKRILTTGTATFVGLAALFVLLAVLATVQLAADEPVLAAELGAEDESISSPAVEVSPTITFPSGPWPWYAQEEISLNPEPPLAGQPTEICAEVINQDQAEPHPARLVFGIAPLSIGLPLEPVGAADVEVPPGGGARGCVVWVPAGPGPWSVEVKLSQPGTQVVQRSQRNLDMLEPLEPGQPLTLTFPVGNPFPQPITASLGLIPHIPGWGFELSQDALYNLTPGEFIPVSLRVTPDDQLPPDGQPIVDVEAYVQQEMIGGIRKIFRPPVPLHRARDPFFAESEIAINPYPPRAGEPTELCVELYNWSDVPQPVEALFSWAEFGIGMPFTPIDGPQGAVVPPHGRQTVCIVWIPPAPDQFCVQVELHLLSKIPYLPQFSQRNLDVIEPLVPGEPHAFQFPVGNFANPFTNPEPVPMTVFLEADVQQPGWEVILEPSVLPDLQPGASQMVTMTVTPPPGLLPADGMPVADVRAMVQGEQGMRLLGGFRKIARPPIALHPMPDPTYAEREITVHPYPPLAGEPTEICVDLRNPTPYPQDVFAHFAWADFGIGLPFTPIGGPHVVHLPPNSMVRECIHWVPPVSGHICLEVTLDIPGYETQRSQRNIDVYEPLQPGVVDSLPFSVSNPFQEPVTITFGLIPHVDGWEFEVVPPVIPNAQPGELQSAELLVQPPPGEPLPQKEIIVVDVEGYGDGKLIGGFRKIHQPPIELHPYPDPPYAEREISVHPYPPQAGEPTEICVDLRNPTPFPQDVVVHFAWADFGIGLPFTPIDGPRPVHLPPYSLVRECIHWVPPVSGHVCLEVTLDMPGYAPQRSQRNIDVYEPLQPGVTDPLPFKVGNPFQEPVTITFGLIPHVDGWEIQVVPPEISNVQPGETLDVELLVQPPPGMPLPSEEVVVADIEAYGDGRLIGGFRKVHRPPVPLHPFPDPPYAEREITIHPYPPLEGQPSEICVELRNPTPFPQDVDISFAWASFGIGLPFQPIDGIRTVHLPPHSIVNECIHWVPPVSGQVCLEVILDIPGYAPQRSQRNIDVIEPLKPNTPDKLIFTVGNPTDHVADIELGLVPHLPGWHFELMPSMLAGVQPGATRPVTLTVVPPDDMPDIGQPIVDVEAFAGGRLLGGFRKIFQPPIPLHPFPDPPFAEREISVHPYPPLAGEPTEICVEIRNPTAVPYDVTARFAWASFGVGVPFTPIDGARLVHLPPHSIVNECIHWVPPANGQVCLEVTLEMEGYAPQRSQRNIDVIEPLKPGVEDNLSFVVGNPTTETVTITLGLVQRLPDWQISLSPDTLSMVEPGATREVTLTVKPPAELPPDGQAILEVEAYIDAELIGGFRKIFRPPIPLHPFPDPAYAEREITIQPYPPRAGEPTEVCVDLRNPTPFPQDVLVRFAWANFGIGLPFTPIDGPRPVHLEPYSIVRECIHWIPPVGGQTCIEVVLDLPGHEPQRSRLNVDVSEPLEPGKPHSLAFNVGNPTNETLTITMGLIPHLPDWGLEITPDVLTNMQPGETRPVTLTVTPPADLPEDGQPIVDVEAYADGRLLGGFRKIFRPPVPVHRPKDPIYAESEIGVDPYPVIPGQPTKLSVEVFNPTAQDRVVTATFSIAPFGIGLPFSTTHIVPNPIRIFVPAHGAARGHVVWLPPDWSGKFCVQVTLQMAGQEPVWSQRNIDAGEPLRPGQPHELVFPVGNPTNETATIELGLVKHRPDWQITLSKRFLENMAPGVVTSVTLTVTPPQGVELGLGEPIVDVEAFIEGRLIGGFRKVDRPPVPLHKPHEKGYAESEIIIDPYPPKLGVTSQVSTVVQNTSAETMTIDLEFGWAVFGMGIPFTTTGMTPYTTSLTLGPAMTQTVGIDWEPTLSGHQCVMIMLSDPEGVYEPQRSQRNVDVVERPPCGQTKVFTFTVQNDTPLSATVDIGTITFNVPADWLVTTIPSDTLVLDAGATGVVTVMVTIPCPPTDLAWDAYFDILAIQEEAGSVPTVDVEGYIEGELVGGIELQFAGEEAPPETFVYLPVIIKP